MIMNALIFGTGKFYHKYKYRVPCKVIGLVDNNQNKIGSQLDGYTIMSVENMVTCDYDCVFILVKDYADIKGQLEERGVPEDKIFTYENVSADFCVDDDFSDLKKSGQKSIILFSHTFSVTGAALELYYISVCLKNMGCSVYVAAPDSGAMQKMYREKEIQTIIDDRISMCSLDQIEWVAQFDYIWINTAVLCTLLKEVAEPKNTIVLWLHEPKYWYRLVSKSVLANISLQRLKVCAVSDVATDAFCEYNNSFKIEPLLIGVPEKVLPRKQHEGVMNFSVVAEVFNLKGQDVLLHALCFLSKEIINRINIFFVGRIQTEFFRQLEILLSWFPNVHVLGEKARNEICEIYAETDVLICPSREESFSLVTVEAMMNGVPAIVSSNTGVSYYIEDMKDGFVFESENAEMLAKRIEWCYRNRDKCVSVGKAARKKYEKLFSMSAFENRLSYLFAKEWNIK